MKLVVALIAALPLAAQQETRPASISGQVVNEVTGEPVRKAQIFLVRTGSGGAPAGTPSAESDTSGNFRISNLPAGSYRASANRTGFATGSRRSASAFTAPIVLAEGQDVSGVVVKLTPAAVITGRAIDEDGDPVEAVSIQLLRTQYVNGRRLLLPFRGAVTNDLGEYRLSGIEPGRYLLSATRRGLANTTYNDPPPSSGERPPEYQYATLYYPGALDQSAATPLRVPAGADLRGIDFRLQKARVFRIRGRVTGLAAMEGNQRASAVVFIDPASPGGLIDRRPAPVLQDGTFEAREVRPGSYWVVAQQGNREMQLSARMPVTVGEGDLSGIEVALQPNVKVAGRVAVEGDAPLAAPGMGVQFQPFEGPISGSGMARVNPETAAFESNPLEPNRYRVVVQPLPQGMYLKSVRWGDQDVSDAGLLLMPGAAGELRVTLAPGAGSISVTVRDAKDQPLPNAVVTLVPDSRYANWWDLYRYVSVSDNGQATIQSVRPGTYKVYAWEQIENGAHQDAAFLRPFESSGLSVTVQPGGSESVQLTAIPASVVENRP